MPPPMNRPSTGTIQCLLRYGRDRVHDAIPARSAPDAIARPAPDETPPKLPRDVAMQVAELARIPPGEREPFCDAICWIGQRVWERDRALGEAGSSPA